MHQPNPIGILIVLVFAIFYVYAYTRIVRQAGNSGWIVLLGAIPIVNIIAFFWFAFSEWPVRRELNEAYEQMKRR